MPDKKEEKKPIRKGYQGKTIPELSQDELKEAYADQGSGTPLAFSICVAASLWSHGLVKPYHTAKERKKIMSAYLGRWVLTLPL